MITQLTDENKKELVRSIVVKNFKNRKNELNIKLADIAELIYVKSLGIDLIGQMRELPSGFFKEIFTLWASFDSIHDEQHISLTLPKNNKFPITYAIHSNGDLRCWAAKGSRAWVLYCNYLEKLDLYHAQKDVFTKELEAFLSQFVAINSIIAAWPPIAPFMEQFGYHKEASNYGTDKLNKLWGTN